MILPRVKCKIHKYANTDLGKGNGIFQWEGKGNLRVVFPGIAGNGNHP